MEQQDGQSIRNIRYYLQLLAVQIYDGKYGANTFGQYYKTPGADGQGWKYTNYWKTPGSGTSGRKWGDMNAMKAAGVLPMAGDVIVFCDGRYISNNSLGDTISVVHVGIVATDTDEQGVFYTVEGNYSDTGAVVINKRSVAATYTNYDRMNINPDSKDGGHYKLYAILHNTSDVVRNLVVQTAFNEKTKYDANPSAYVKQIHTDMSYDGNWCCGFVARVVLEKPTTGTLQLKASTPVPSHNGTLDGAEYVVYKDAACTMQAAPGALNRFTTGKDGTIEGSLSLAPGKYYLRQTKAPANGAFKKNTVISEIEITSGQTNTYTGGIMNLIPTTLKAYFVGNSYTNRNSLPSQVAAAFEKDGIKLETKMYSVDDSYLKQHVNNAAVKADISSGDYDFVILQEESHDVRDKTSDSVSYVKTMMSWAPSSTHFYLYQTMSYQGEPGNQYLWVNAYNTIAQATGATVIPAGEAFWAYASAHPDEKMFTDWQHPSYTGSSVVAQSMHDTIMKDKTVTDMLAAEEAIKKSSSSSGVITSGKNGDVNGDGVIDPRDYVIIKNHILKTKVITDQAILAAADVNGDGLIDPRDYVRVKNIILGK